jgi:hypothetical protein
MSRANSIFCLAAGGSAALSAASVGATVKISTAAARHAASLMDIELLYARGQAALICWKHCGIVARPSGKPKNVVRPAAKPKHAPPKMRPIARILQRLGRMIPEEERRRFPKDLTSQVDHYVYGTPKRPTDEELPWYAGTTMARPTGKTKSAAQPAAKPKRTSSKMPPIARIAQRLGRMIPEEELRRIPKDLSSQVDHYVYGKPKR